MNTLLVNLLDALQSVEGRLVERGLFLINIEGRVVVVFILPMHIL